MKILDTRVMRGPNYWSVKRHQLIVMKLDLEELEDFPTSKIPGFYERITQLLPSMEAHRCSEGRPGGFFFRVQEGTWMGHVIEHMAIEIQSLAGMYCAFGQTRSNTEHGVYYVVFDYVEEEVGLYAAKAAVRIAEDLINGTDREEMQRRLANDIQTMREIRQQVRLGPSTAAIVEEAERRGIPWSRLNQQSLITLGYGVNQRRIQATISSLTSNIAVDIAGNKEDTKTLLEDSFIPVPKGILIYNTDNLRESVEELGFPLVMKPVGGNHGRGATIGIHTCEQAIEAFRVAQEVSEGVIIERFINGFDHRVLVVNSKLVAAAKRTPAAVIGDGESTIDQLIAQVNADPRRGFGHEKVLTLIEVDEMTRNILADRKLTLQSVLSAGEVLFLKETANLSTGGTSADVTDSVHPDNVFMFERIARIVGLDICGIDVMAPDLSTPINENGGAVLEVNAAPGFRMHLAPTEGIPRNVAAPVVDMLFPIGCTPRIPVVAITGTNGKTTCTRLMAHIAKIKGYKVGFTTTEGIYIQDRMIYKGDCTGPVSTELVLRDPTIDFAVLECARGGMLRAGLGFDQCDIGIVTNIAADHLGLNGIHTLEQMARVKAIIPESVSESGYAILNADDDLVYAMGEDLDCYVAYFSLDENNPRIVEHCRAGGIAAVLEDSYITICKGEWKIRIEKVVNIPLSFNGKALFMIQNILPVVLAAYLRNFELDHIRYALRTFIPSPALTPGRMNIFQFQDFQVMVDYAHNPAGFQAIGNFLALIDDTPKVGVITGVGDRRDEDIQLLGKLAAEMFDEIVIRLDKDLRGRQSSEVVELITRGIEEVNMHKKVDVIPDENDALRHVIKNAKKGSFITICCEDITNTLRTVMRYKDEEDNFEQTMDDAVKSWQARTSRRKAESNASN